MRPVDSLRAEAFMDRWEQVLARMRWTRLSSFVVALPTGRVIDDQTESHPSSLESLAGMGVKGPALHALSSTSSFKAP